MSAVDDDFQDIFDEFSDEDEKPKKIEVKKDTKKTETKKTESKKKTTTKKEEKPETKPEQSEEDELLEFLDDEAEKKPETKSKVKIIDDVKKTESSKPVSNTSDRKKNIPRPRDRGELKAAQKSATGLEIPEVEYMTPEDVREADTWFIYGEKSDGKTSFAMSFPGNILVLQFDEKAGVVWKEDFNSDERIKIVDITKILRADDPILYLQTSTLALAYIEKVLDKARDDNFDWVLIDGFESYASMAEMAMRFDQNIRYAEGVPQQTWKVRTLFMTQLHKRCLNVGKRGIIYTTYPFIQETIEFNGKTVRSKKPSWKKDSEKETDQLVFCYSEDDEKGTEFWIHLEKMKRGFFTGKRINITTQKGKPRMGYQLTMENASMK